jgi:outer membrane receptor for ferrienterochelin and colicins
MFILSFCVFLFAAPLGARQTSGTLVVIVRSDSGEPVPQVEVQVGDQVAQVEEKTTMSPGDIALLLNETSGVRVQTTSPSLGAANARSRSAREFMYE